MDRLPRDETCREKPYHRVADIAGATDPAGQSARRAAPPKKARLSSADIVFYFPESTTPGETYNTWYEFTADLDTWELV